MVHGHFLGRDGMSTPEEHCILCKGDFEDYVLNSCCLYNTSAMACTEEKKRNGFWF